MNLQFRLIPLSLIFTLFPLFLTACSGQSFPGSQLLSSQSSRPAPLKRLKKVTTTINAKKAWQVGTGNPMGENKIHPYLDNQAIFIAGGNSASSWQKSTGKLLWKSSIGETVSAGVNGTFAINSQSHKAQQVFVGTTNGNAIALDANTGKIKWIERLSSEVLSISPSKNNRVAFRTVDGKLHGLNSNTGELIWQRSQKTPALTQSGASVPIIVSPFVIAGFDNGKIAAYSLQNGKPAWEVTMALPRGDTELDRIIDIDGKLKPLGNALFAASLNGSSSGINLENGKQAWSRDFSSPSGVNVDPQGFYSSDDKGNVWKIDPRSGNPLWSMDDLQRRQPTVPAIVNSSLLVIGDKQGNLHWVNTSNGEFVARSKGDPAGYSVEPEVSGKSVYAFGKSGVLSKLVVQ